MKSREELQTDFRNSISLHYPMAEYLASAAIVINDKSEILYFSPAASKIFDFDSDKIVGAEASVLKLPGLTHELIEAFFEGMRSPDQLLPPGRPLNGGAPFELINLDKKIKVSAFLYPLSVNDYWHTAIFFQIHEAIKTGIYPEFVNSDNPFIQKAQAIIFFFRTSPTLAIIIGTGFGLWIIIPNVHNLSSILPKEKPPIVEPQTETFKISAKKSEALQAALDEFRHTLPEPDLLRVYVSFYIDQEAGLYAVVPVGGQSSNGMGRITPGRYKVSAGTMMDHFEKDRDSHCYITTNPDDLKDAFEMRLVQRFSQFHVSCGFLLPEKTSPAPHVGFLAVEGVNAATDTAAIAAQTESWAPKIQEILAKR